MLLFWLFVVGLLTSCAAQPTAPPKSQSCVGDNGMCEIPKPKVKP